MYIGRAFLKDNHWFVEEESGMKFPVRSGESGNYHPILQRGRHENALVSFELSSFRLKQIAIVIEIVQ